MSFVYGIVRYFTMWIIRGLYVTVMQLTSLHTRSAERGWDRPEIISNRLQWRKNLIFPRSCVFREEHKQQSSEWHVISISDLLVWLTFGKNQSLGSRSELWKASWYSWTKDTCSRLYTTPSKADCSIVHPRNCNQYVSVIMLYLTKTSSQLWRNIFFCSKHGVAQFVHKLKLWKSISSSQ